ncbi:MAG TPA: Hpt domain-containing protein [Acidobacteriota bacterium]|nr:Hpt domain-containing protein [Acidobacteriota bacterium]
MTQYVKTAEPFDLKKAMRHVDYDSKLFREMADLFQQRYRILLDSARKAIDAKDAKAIDFTAHVIHGTVANFAAYRAQELARNLEKIVSENRMESLYGSYEELEEEVEKLAESLSRCLSEGWYESSDSRG